MLTQANLKMILHYDEETGNFHRKLRQKGIQTVGEIAGTLTSYGYIRISLFSKQYMAHRLAYLYMEGELPNKYIQVDHIDRNRANNKWSNLRKATNMDNSYNTVMRKSNTSGVKGVSQHKTTKMFEAYLSANGSKVYLGSYLTLEEATKAVRIAREELHGEFANHG